MIMNIERNAAIRKTNPITQGNLVHLLFQPKSEFVMLQFGNISFTQQIKPESELTKLREAAEQTSRGVKQQWLSQYLPEPASAADKFAADLFALYGGNFLSTLFKSAVSPEESYFTDSDSNTLFSRGENTMDPFQRSRIVFAFGKTLTMTHEGHSSTTTQTKYQEDCILHDVVLDDAKLALIQEVQALLVRRKIFLFFSESNQSITDRVLSHLREKGLSYQVKIKGGRLQILSILVTGEFLEILDRTNYLCASSIQAVSPIKRPTEFQVFKGKVRFAGILSAREIVAVKRMMELQKEINAILESIDAGSGMFGNKIRDMFEAKGANAMPPELLHLLEELLTSLNFGTLYTESWRVTGFSFIAMDIFEACYPGLVPEMVPLEMPEYPSNCCTACCIKCCFRADVSQHVLPLMQPTTQRHPSA